MRQGDKVGVLKVTKPTSSTLAGYLTSTVQDTSGWSGDHDGNKVNQGYMALSSTASTTITNCDTNYPDLWANAPTAWRSGSSLVIPAQGGNAVGEWIDYTPTLSGVTATSVGGTYRVEGDSIRIRIRIIISSVSGGITVGMPSGFTEDTTKYPSNSNSGFYGTAVGVDASANAVWVGSCYFPSAGNIAFYGPDGTSSIWDAVDPFSWTSGDTLTMEVVVPVEELSGNTPVISLQNNIAAGALGLPAATATQAGTVKKNKWQKKYLTADVTTTTADVTSLKFNNLVIGKMYRARLQMNCDLPNDSGTDSCRLTLNNNGVEICRAYVYKNGVADETHALTISAEGVFEATTTTMIASATISGTGVIRFTSSLTNVILEELNNYDTETTDFT